ncbi:MAG TPA: hypothetical protein VF158_04650 [Longimicrobiales bacterium]
MIVRHAYTDEQIRICRPHYEGARPLPEDAPPLGPILDARGWWGCRFCEQEQDSPLDVMRMRRQGAAWFRGRGLRRPAELLELADTETVRTVAAMISVLDPEGWEEAARN